MPIYLYQCGVCSYTEEHYNDYNTREITCEKCGKVSTRIISTSGVNTINEDAAWLRTVIEVVDKEGGRHCQEFIKNPTRKNYKNWMKGEGIRPMDTGEGMGKPEKPDMKKIEREVMQKFARDHQLELGG